MTGSQLSTALLVGAALVIFAFPLLAPEKAPARPAAVAGAETAAPETAGEFSLARKAYPIRPSLDRARAWILGRPETTHARSSDPAIEPPHAEATGAGARVERALAPLQANAARD